ncbi:TIR domain-containing protein [Stenotrophomonas maltophilia]|uniref:TIR domain-containing protein n=1 Tax=Stenotrophomonas maltophilia TaxID=40324 RepID=UPI0039F6CD5D
MTEQERKLKVFISYASEDRSFAQSIRDQIDAEGHSPWFDQDILPGQQWEGEIDRNLKAADVVVIVLSKSSVNKRGLVQREAAKAIDKLDNLLPTDIYIIPVRIDDCEPPERISGRIQFIDMHRDDARSRIATSLRIAAIDRGIPTHESKRIGPFSIRYQATTDSLPGKFGYENTFEYPAVSSTSHPKLARELSEYFAGRAAVERINCREDPLYEWDAPEWALGSSRQSRIEIVSACIPIISCQDHIYSYSSGAAHGNGYSESMNFLVAHESLSKFTLESITRSDETALAKLSDLCVNGLIAQFWEKTNDEADEDALRWFQEGAGPHWRNFEAFTVSPKGISVNFPPYQVAPYVMGFWDVFIPKFELRKIESFKDLLKVMDACTTED